MSPEVVITAAIAAPAGVLAMLALWGDRIDARRRAEREQVEQAEQWVELIEQVAVTITAMAGAATAALQEFADRFGALADAMLDERRQRPGEPFDAYWRRMLDRQKGA